MKRVLLSVLSLVLFAGTAAVADEASRNQAISERIKPFGQECLQGDPCATMPVPQRRSGGARSGEAIYTTYCATCHTPGLAGAPKLGVAADWSARNAKGLDALLSSATQGLGGMPAMGLCLDCSQDELRDSIEYILANSR